MEAWTSFIQHATHERGRKCTLMKIRGSFWSGIVWICWFILYAIFYSVFKFLVKDIWAVSVLSLGVIPDWLSLVFRWQRTQKALDTVNESELANTKSIRCKALRWDRERKALGHIAWCWDEGGSENRRTHRPKWQWPHMSARVASSTRLEGSFVTCQGWVNQDFCFFKWDYIIYGLFSSVSLSQTTSILWLLK